MGLESATFINGLVETNPTSSDNANQGDNHIRLIKSAIKATFPSVTGAVTASHTDLNTVTAKVNRAGDTLTGFLTLHAAPTSGNHAATKTYVDTGIATKANLVHTHVTADVTGLDAALATRVRVDTATQGLTSTEQANARTNLGLTATAIAPTTDGITEGVTKLFFTNARARAALSAGTGIAYDSATGVISSTVSAPVTSVAGKTGAVTLASADITDFASQLATRLATTGGTLSGALTVSTGGLTLTSGNLTLSGGNISVTGTITASGDITAFSDARLKDHVETIGEALHKVKSLRGVSYVSKLDNDVHIGVIAQEVERVVPEVVHTHGDGLKSVAYQNLVGLLIEAVKDLSAKVEALEKK